MTERATATRSTEKAPPGSTPASPGLAPPSRAVAARLDPALTRLQRSHGNRYVQRVVANSRLNVGAATDVHEAEADRTADRVMRSIGASPSSAAPASAHSCGAGCVQRHDGAAGHAATAEVAAAGGTLSGGLSASITSARGGGEALPDGVRTQMESAFGADFSAVRVHAGSDLAGRVGAEAFTLGRDIHFAPGAYRSGERSGKWLLAHELTHVVQQNGIGRVAPQVQRHSSKEHYLLGSLTPDQIRKIASGKEAVGRIGGVLAKAKRQKELRATPEIQEALHVLDQQIAALDRWRSATVDHPNPAQHVAPGGTDYQEYWGGQLVTITCLDRPLVATLGDLNALPDFFGSLDDVATVSSAIVLRTLQVIRRESYIYLKSLRAEIKGKSYSYDAKKEKFKGLKGNAISVSSVLPESLDALKDLEDTETMLAGREGETGLPVQIGAKATLGRNACHFPPESWLRWREHHLRARALVAGASTLAELEQKGNDAIALNAFGEHYLQDSFAGGHLINKGYVMAVALTHLTKTTITNRGITPDVIAEFKRATAHSRAYAIPKDARTRLLLGTDDVADSLADASATTARDPQSALESARGVTARRQRFAQGRVGKSPSEQAKVNEVRGMTLDPSVVDFDMYRTWLNDVYLQKATNSLHNKFCVEGLKVSSPAVQEVFRVYGDANMIRSERGVYETALASRMSQAAINALVENKRMALAGLSGPPRSVCSVNAILERFPNRVHSGGTAVSLEDWATGESMDKLVKAAVHEVLSTAVRVASPLTVVSEGLSPDHGPF